MSSPRLAQLRGAETVVAVYFLYTTVLAFLLPVSLEVRRATVLMNAVVLGGLALVVWAHSLRGRSLLGGLRDWYLPPLMLLAYREMGWFALPHPSRAFEETWVVWDRWLLDQMGLRSAIEALGPVLPVWLELSYTLVYAMPPIALAILYACQRPRRTDTLLFPFTLAVLFTYALYPYFPSDPPWTVFPGADLPSYDTWPRQFNAAMLKSQGIRTSVFPSGHVAGSLTLALAMMRALPEKKWPGRLLLVLALSIALATVYGRYHYAVDAVAGAAISLAAMAVTRRR